MPVLVLNYKDYSLTLVFRQKSYYAGMPFELGKTIFCPDKTLYQILFEHLIDKKTVSLGGFVAKYKEINPEITIGSIALLMKKIEAAVKQSKNPNLRKMRFKRMPHGGANPVLSRTSASSRFTPTQRKTLEETIKEMHKLGKKPSYERIRDACLQALHERYLSENVVLSNLAIWKLKKRLGLPIVKRQRRPKRRL